jgi:sterol desaturase/sphingolipid hydroxylase (fatty acid hydroxylase superfamily)
MSNSPSAYALKFKVYKIELKMENKQQQMKVRIFKNPVLEALTKTSPLITIVVYSQVILLLLYLNFINEVSLKHTIIYFFAGVLTWTFMEYVLHRFLFHFESDTKAGKRIHYILHGVHHTYPRQKDKLFMPPVPGLLMAALFYVLFGLLLGTFVHAFLPGLIAGYLCYVFIHYAIHTVRPPKLFKKLWSHHFLHHHRFSDKCFGVSTPLWDFVFGTMPPKKKNHT